MQEYNVVLSIAGTDPSGGAGIQADLKTFTVLGCYGMSIITALVAQNTTGVQDVCPIPIKFIEQQFDSVLTDIIPDAVKIGMLFNTEIIELVARKLQEYKLKNIVLDPVMIAKSGDTLLKPEAVESLKTKLLPLADLVTPNLAETKVLVSGNLSKIESAKFIHKLGAKNILIKGGHDKGEICEDLLLAYNNEIVTNYPKINTDNNHGTGCTLSSAIAAYLAKDYDMVEAYHMAREFLQKAIESGAKYKIGLGHGPLNHLVNLF
jgi:hydroxymethylpyrimidine/phosphomethylpyrimidine kinase